MEEKAQLLEKGMRPVSCRVVFTLTYKGDYSSLDNKVIEEVSSNQKLWVEVPIELLKKQRQLTIEAGKQEYPLFCKVEGSDIWMPL